MNTAFISREILKDFQLQHPAKFRSSLVAPILGELTQLIKDAAMQDLQSVSIVLAAARSNIQLWIEYGENYTSAIRNGKASFSTISTAYPAAASFHTMSNDPLAFIHVLGILIERARNEGLEMVEQCLSKARSALVLWAANGKYAPAIHETLIGHVRTIFDKWFHVTGHVSAQSAQMRG